MRLSTHFFIAALAIAVFGCASRTSSTHAFPSDLPDLRTGHYKVDPYIQAAVELQSMGHTNALARLHAMARDTKLETRVVILCRMLFTQRPGSDFRRPMIGGALFFGGTDYADWPLEPVGLVDGVPFIITRGYILGGLAESDESYLRYCETNCDWSGCRFATKSAAQKRGALNKLLTSPKWKTPLDTYDTKFFAEQIQ